MDIIINEKSLCSQYTSIQEFYDYMNKEMIPILNMIDKSDGNLYREYSTYSRKVVYDMSIEELMRIQGNPTISALRVYLSKLANDNPFWNNDIKTSSLKQYKSNIEEIPNCITEAYERKGIVLSFSKANFSDEKLILYVDNIEEKVLNASTLTQMKTHFEILGLLSHWKENSFIIKKYNVKFEIRYKEEHHNIKHFHLSTNDFAASISIPDADIIAGALPPGLKSKLISWSLCNMDKISELWNQIHP